MGAGRVLRPANRCGTIATRGIIENCKSLFDNKLYLGTPVAVTGGA